MQKANRTIPGNQRGFTMIELMITVTLVAILASLAAPSMRTYVLNSRITGLSQEVLRTLQTARSEATKRQRSVVVCASGNPTADPDEVTCTASTVNGWIMFEDTGGTVGDHDAGEALIAVQTLDASKLSLVGDGTVSYRPDGFAAPGGATAIVICDDRGNVDSGGGTSGVNSVARGLIIAGTGRARVTKTLSEIRGMLDGLGSTCPP